MWSNEPRSLPDWIEDAYQTLVSGTPDQQTDLSHDQARDLLLADEDFPNEPADAEYAIERLLDSGWLYAVDGELRITDPDH
ncbi:hypothetical protein NDI85_21570 [Halomicroarcula sp. S1AR25-4]|uniref:hypothetical protein n=1 Tax=Haloarcula sp. S1AR25-4 TaxID=2950538 RepID=UPI0028753A97|nr:hypothetical protein [Halomicroarcula sp. S1AR25-4]MDS0280379.1 hypothetical protein [Halomicroarcula sp. S1AR25-4]